MANSLKSSVSRRQFVREGACVGAFLVGNVPHWLVADDGEEPKGKLIRIASHNVYWGQGAAFRAAPDPMAKKPKPAPASSASPESPAKTAPAAVSNPIPPPARLEVWKGLAKVYLDYEADIVSLQEIQSEEAAKSMAEVLDMNYVYQPGGAYPQYGGAVFSHWPMQQLPLEHVSPSRILVRVEVAVEGAKPFQLIDVHLPSGRQLGGPAGAAKRLEEIGAAAGHADILAGDFNQSISAAHAPLLTKKGYSLLEAKPEDENGKFPYRKTIIDQAWIRSEYRDRVVDFSYFSPPLVEESKIKESLSDHPGMLFTLRWE